ncbi:Peptidase inhibitor 16, partial [Dissostichus eleginoides]
MHQGVSTQQGVSTRRTTQDEGSWSSRSRRGSSCRSLCPPSGAPLWAWLLLGALLVPGAWSFLNEEQEELLVELHNHYRGQVSPSASAMMPLFECLESESLAIPSWQNQFLIKHVLVQKWDANLKVIAEGYAAKCVWNHNPELKETGENLFAGTGPLDIREALEKWFLDTHRVGCAFHFCNNMEGLDWERVSYLVCNYYPTGNYEEERPYVEGEWCSRCPENLQKCENNLCDEGDFAAASQPDTTSTPSITTTSDWDSEEAQPTPAPGTTPPPETPSTTPEEEEIEEKVEKEEEEKEEMEQREEKAERD